jgi:peptidoglycan/LPS O-acetylase OafA/YrhL
MPAAGFLFAREQRLVDDQSLRVNCIDATRLLLAVAVIFSHSYPLTGSASEPLLAWSGGQKSFGDIAVDVFFLLSGFLIVKSWLYSRGMRDYLHRRILRIYPGYMVTMVVSLLLAAASSGSVRQFMSELHFKHFLKALFTFDYSVLNGPAGSFLGNPYHAVNGSLWTIALEFSCYLAIALYGLFGLYQYRRLSLLVLTAMLAGYEFRLFRGENPNTALWGLGCVFMAGSALFLFRDRVPRSRLMLLACLGATVAGVFKSPWLNAVFPVTAAYVTFYAVMRPAPAWLAWTHRADLSYGTYLYGFVIQQSVIYWLKIEQPAALFFVSAAVTLAFAAASWFLVESPCLKLKRHSFDDHDPVRSLLKTRPPAESPAAVFERAETTGEA